MSARGGNADRSTAAEGANEIKGEIVAPSFVNNPWVRAIVLILAIVATARSTLFVPGSLAAFVHISAFGFWFGASIWVSLIGSLVMFKNMKRQDFGRIQSKLFPKYFASTSAAIVALVFTTPRVSTPPWLLIASLIATMTNWLFVEPITSAVMLERYNLQTTSADDPDTKAEVKRLHKRFSKLHGISSALNLVSLFAAMAYAWWLGTVLHHATQAQ